MPSNVDPNVDCAIKELAWNYSKILLPERGNLLSVFDALQLQARCNVSRPEHEELNVIRRRSTKSFDYSSNVIFVHPNKGSDENDGREISPVATLEKATDLCRQRRHNRKDCTIYLMKGVHELRQTLNLGPKESNTHFIGDDAIISGGKVVAPEWKLYENSMRLSSGQNAIFYDDLKPGESSKSVKFMKKINTSETCSNSCDKDNKCTAFVFLSTGLYKSMCYFRYDGLWNIEPQSGCISGKKINIYEADLKEFNLKPFNSLFINGRRVVRARFPNGNPETGGLHTRPTGYVNNALKWLPAKHSPPAVDIQIKNPYRPHNQFPIFQLGIGGSVEQFNPPESYWATKAPYGGVTYKVPSGLVYSKSLEISKNIWSKPEKGIVHTLMRYHWGGWQFQIDARNTSSNTISWSKGGFQEARGDIAGAEWYVENIFEELDEAGEWYYDDEKNKLYYFPNGSLPEQVTISQFESLISIKGSQSKPVFNISFSQITFTETSSTFLESYEVPSAGDYSIHRNAALFIEGADNVVVDDCLFKNIGGNALFLSKYIRNAVISNNEFLWIGDNAIAVIGSSQLIDGTDGNQPRGVKIVRNLAHEIGLFGKQTAAYFQSVTCQTLLEGNVFFNGPRAGVNFNDGFGGGSNVTKNLLFNFVRETKDHGPFNSWDRQPYLTKVKHEKTASLTPKENYMTYNFIINNFNSYWPIDHDDGSAYFTDQYNYLIYGGFKNYLGHSKTSQFNVYIYPDANPVYNVRYCAGSSGSRTGPLASGWGDRYTDNICIIKNEQVYSYPNCHLKNISQLIPFTARNKFYTPNANVIFKCASHTWTLSEYQKIGFDLGTTVSKLVDTKQIIQWGKDVLNIE